ncbi:phage holin family protein [Niabella hibiscisoli]|uniref:phage holin family protein n=1 Tax=Niabella hibiscisoli TaxID=1825928 RepID=UPI001F10082C|nr:phage holin family protein [Niabella hibiscisoli]MCH5720402.1 phage holin family protein [Niabella hibiscisoli]
MNSFIQYWPTTHLLIWLLIVYTWDFLFGVCKSIIKGTPRTSQGFRQSIIKLLQYGGCILIAIVILNIVYVSNEPFGQKFAWIFGDIMLYFMIYIEVVSVLENMEAMAPSSFFVRLFVRPVRRIITFQLKNLFQEDAATKNFRNKNKSHI